MRAAGQRGVNFSQAALAGSSWWPTTEMTFDLRAIKSTEFV